MKLKKLKDYEYLDSTSIMHNKELLSVVLGNKVDKITGKGLSTNDFTDAYKTKIDGIATGATKNTVENSLTSTSTSNALSAYQGKVLNEKFSATTLYSNSSGTTSAITLSDSVANYKYIEIRYTGVNGEPYSTGKISISSLSRIHLSGFFIGSGGLLNVANGRIAISAKALTWASNRTVIDGTYNASGNGIHIVEILGYKQQ